MRRHLLLSVTCLAALFMSACATRKRIIGEDIIYMSPMFNSKLILWNDGSFIFSARDVHGRMNNDHSIQGAWETRNNRIVLNSFNQPSDYDNLVVVESISGSQDSVYFNYFLIDSNVKSHTFDTTTYALTGISSIEPNNKGERFFFRKNTVKSGFAIQKTKLETLVFHGLLTDYPVYQVKDVDANTFSLYENVRKLERYCQFYPDYSYFTNEELVAVGDKLVLNNHIEFVRKCKVQCK